MRIFNIILSVAVVFTLGSCQSGCSDSPVERSDSESQVRAAKFRLPSNKDRESKVEYNYSVDDLEGDWICYTQQGDLSDYFSFNISKASDTELLISNFHNLGKSVKAKLEGNRLTFDGILNQNFQIVNSQAVITQGYQQIDASYSLKDDENQVDDFVVQFIKGVPTARGIKIAK